jgi:predicted NUDIX family NTP pyrophosphohydrolase
MPQRSAGVLLYRRTGEGIEVLLVHPGGPFWRNRDVGSWQIPKGLIEPDEQPAAAARREAEEELGLALAGAPWWLATIRQKGGKIVEAFALEQDIDPAAVSSNNFTLEWPPRSGRMQDFPEIDGARWFALAEARDLMLDSQKPLLDAFREVIRREGWDLRPGP